MEFKFGDYVTIEQNRYGADNEHYVYKVIGTSQSNAWVEVPVVGVERETVHAGKLESVVHCICCGIDETDVCYFRAADIKLHGNESDPKVVDLTAKLDESRHEVQRLMRLCGEAASKLSLDWVCRSCDTEFDSSGDICPECGSDNIEENDMVYSFVSKLRDASENGLQETSND